MSYTLRQNPVTKHFDIGRAGNKVNKIVIHHAATTDFDGIARTFNGTRQASAHYGVGRNNNVDQYVSEDNTAWHAANYPANLTSIGIENVNSSGAPNWDIAPETFNTLVELVRDIARRHGLLPLKVGVNLFGHRDFIATACPGQLYGRLQELADKVNGGSSAPGPTPQLGKKSNDQVANEVLAGQWGNNPERRERLMAAGYDYNAIQSIVNSKVGNPSAAPRKGIEVIASEVLAGAWGNGDDRKKRLQAAGYDYASVQKLVNQKLGIGGSSQVARPANETIADQVLAGAWGNGDDRRNRLRAAGYDYDAIQSIVNQRLGIGNAAPARKSNDQVANEVIAGNWGNGQERKDRLTAAGYDYGAVQALVNRKLGL